MSEYHLHHEHNERHEAISPTAWGVAYCRTFTDIPYAREIFDEMERRIGKEDSLRLPEDLKLERITPMFEARYKLINRLLRENRVGQILELATGFAPRGLEFSDDAGIQYVELDLPAVAEQKRRVVESLYAGTAIKPRKNLQIVAGNALNFDDLSGAIEGFRAEQPLTVVNEGLLRYLNFDQKATVARNIHKLLDRFGGQWITSDISVMGHKLAEEKYMKEQNKRISEIVKVNIDQNRFENEQEAHQFFENLGFTIESHDFAEMYDQLVSPGLLNQSKQETMEILGPSVVFVMRPRL